MTVVALVPTTVSRAYQDFTALPTAANAGGNSFPNTGTEQVYINNASGGSITASFTITATVDTIVPAARTVTLPAGKWTIVGPWPGQYYNDASSPAVVTITYSAVTSVTVAVFKPGS